MNTSTTPETDAFMALIDDSTVDPEMIESKLGQLERERNEANKELALLRNTPLRQKVQQLERDVEHWCDRHTAASMQIDQLRARVAELEKLLQRWLPFGEFNAPPPSHNGPCGFGDCDAGCMDAAIASLLIQETRQAIDASKGQQ